MAALGDMDGDGMQEMVFGTSLGTGSVSGIAGGIASVMYGIGETWTVASTASPSPSSFPFPSASASGSPSASSFPFPSASASGSPLPSASPVYSVWSALTKTTFELGVDPIDAAGDSARTGKLFGSSGIVVDAGNGNAYLLVTSNWDDGIMPDNTTGPVGALRFIPRDPTTGRLDSAATVHRFAPGSGLPDGLFGTGQAIGEDMAQVGSALYDSGTGMSSFVVAIGAPLANDAILGLSFSGGMHLMQFEGIFPDLYLVDTTFVGAYELSLFGMSGFADTDVIGTGVAYCPTRDILYLGGRGHDGTVNTDIGFIFSTTISTNPLQLTSASLLWAGTDSQGADLPDLANGAVKLSHRFTDVDGDGYTDLLVGADGSAYNGALILLLDQLGTSVLDIVEMGSASLYKPTGFPDLSIESPHCGTGLDFYDIDVDGTDDLIMHCFNSSYGSQVRVLFLENAAGTGASSVSVRDSAMFDVPELEGNGLWVPTCLTALGHDLGFDYQSPSVLVGKINDPVDGVPDSGQMVVLTIAGPQSPTPSPTPTPSSTPSASPSPSAFPSISPSPSVTPSYLSWHAISKATY